jgi:long-chain acyl-CoA synthetase
MQMETIPKQFLHTVETFDRKDAFRTKHDGRWVDMSHREALDRVYGAALGLQSLGLARGDRIAIISENRVEWALSDMAILSMGGINVPVYPTLPSSQAEYILRDSEARAIFVSTPEQLDKILSVRKNLPMLQHIIAFETEMGGNGIMTLGELIAMGKAVENPPAYETLIASIGKNDWATIIYTSGTTGVPKGVILTHWNLMSNVHAALSVFDITRQDACLSFLPLSHSLERMAGWYTMMTAGVSIAYAESVEKVADNLREVQPSVVIGVPRLYEKIYARILDAVESGPPLKRKLFYWAVKQGQKYATEQLGSGKVKGTTKFTRGIADRLVFAKLKARTGGKMHFFVSGGAPLAKEIAEFFYAAGLPVLEGYGLTETAPLLAVNTFENLRFGSVGQPAPGVDIRIAEDGEILARGPNVMPGYYKRPDDTAEVIKEGWFHTGDIGYLDEDNFLFITDRKKDIIVTAGGKNVAPQAIENLVKQSPYVTEAVVIGDHRPYCSALIVPTFEKLDEYAEANGIPNTTRAELLSNEKVRALYEAEIERMCDRLASYETPHKFALIDRELTVDDGDLTPSLKVKRRVIEKKYAALIEQMYS